MLWKKTKCYSAGWASDVTGKLKAIFLGFHLVLSQQIIANGFPHFQLARIVLVLLFKAMAGWITNAISLEHVDYVKMVLFNFKMF